jgi:hypothetical protein
MGSGGQDTKSDGALYVSVVIKDHILSGGIA